VNEVLNPFPGIRPFREDDAPFFFGRSHLVEELEKKLEGSRFVSVVGVSGCGKSSLMSAGLLPTLKQKNWRIVITRPQNDPITRLAEELKKIEFIADAPIHTKEYAESLTGIQSVSEEELYALWEEMIPHTLEMTSQGIIDTYQQSKSDKKLLIIVDQFEEIFKYKSSGPRERDNAIKFVNLLLEAARQKEFPLHVIFVMRSDFLGNCSEFKGLPELINEGQFLIPRLTRDQHREAIVEPLAKQGVSIAGNVVSQLLNDIEDDPDQLPILQHALMSTYEGWRRDEHRGEIVTIDHYNAAGGMKGSIDSHCDQIFEELQTAGFALPAKIIFQRLTEINLEGYEIRSPASVLDLISLTNLPFESVHIILDAFRLDGRNFLIPPHNKILTSNSVIDLSHECIMRKWDRLREWISEEEQDKRDLVKLVGHYRNFKEEERGYLRGLTLTNYLSWTKFKTSGEITVKCWASRYTTDFKEALDFVLASRENSLSIQRKRVLKRRLLISIPILLILGFAIFYTYLIKVEVDEKNSDLDVQENSLMARQLAIDDLETRLKGMMDSVRQVSSDTQLDTARLLRRRAEFFAQENRKLNNENLHLKHDHDLLLKKVDSLRVLFTMQTTTASALNAALSGQSLKSKTTVDSLASIFKREAASLNALYKKELEKAAYKLSDSLNTWQRNIQVEREMKNYFAGLFTEELKKNRLLLSELERKFNKQIQDDSIDPALASEVKKYIDDSRKKLGSMLGNVSADHKIILYASQLNGDEKMKEFLRLLKYEGFDGEVKPLTRHNSYFKNSGITILASDDITRGLLKNFIATSKFRNEKLTEKDWRDWQIERTGRMQTIIILDY
jgi:energy-coupling factor transporter ATP-binding protein EcfA2